MRREWISRLILAASCGPAALIMAEWPEDAEAQGAPVSLTQSTSVSCKPFNLITADAGMTVITGCNGFRAVAVESESEATVYICQQTGGTKENYATVCLKRCAGCTNGAAYSADQTQGTLHCVSGTADAGVTLAVVCGR